MTASIVEFHDGVAGLGKQVSRQIRFQTLKVKSKWDCVIFIQFLKELAN